MCSFSGICYSSTKDDNIAAMVGLSRHLPSLPLEQAHLWSRLVLLGIILTLTTSYLFSPSQEGNEGTGEAAAAAHLALYTRGVGTQQKRVRGRGQIKEMMKK